MSTSSRSRLKKLYRRIGSNKVEPVEAVPHQVIATYHVKPPKLAPMSDKINSELTKISVRG